MGSHGDKGPSAIYSIYCCAGTGPTAPSSISATTPRKCGTDPYFTWAEPRGAIRAKLSKARARRKYGKRGLSPISPNHLSAQAIRSHREPWLLAASAGLNHLSAQAIVALYAQRMRIEQSFRDAKNLRFGLGLEATRSRSAQRLEMLLHIAHLASFVQRLIDEDAKRRQLELNLVSALRAKRAEVSGLTLGRRILDAPTSWLHRLKPWRAIGPLTAQGANACAAS